MTVSQLINRLNGFHGMPAYENEPYCSDSQKQYFITDIVVVLRDVLQLHEDKRHAVHESDYIRAAATAERTAQPQLAHAKEVVVRWHIEVKDTQMDFLL